MTTPGLRPAVQDLSWTTIRGALAIVCNPQLIRRTLTIAATVGTILSLINQGHILFGGDPTVATWLRVAANYLVPFTVSNIGALAATHR